MWRIVVIVGLVMFIAGVLIDGRSPVVAIRALFERRSSTTAEQPSNSVQIIPTMTLALSTNTPIKTLTPSKTATARPSLTPMPTETVPPTLTPLPKFLRFYRKSLDDDARCVSVQIRGISTKNWTFRINGTRKVANFDNAGNARICKLKREQEFLFTVFNSRGIAVIGGIDVPSKGGAIMIADWK